MITRDTTHLGDGVYVGHDGHQLWIGANHHENMTVALEPGAYTQLVLYAARVLGWQVTVPQRETEGGDT